MMFVQWFLRPALLHLASEQRLVLMHEVLTRFFRGVLIACVLVLVTGFWMIGRVAKSTVQAGGSFDMPIAWWVMAVVGTLMVAIFMHIRFAPFRRLGDAIKFTAWDKAGQALGQIRNLVAVNLTLGVLLIVYVLLA
ncbi:CopD family protein [Orrella marina]|uniref:CopD family protein n=1 Tax=Orrella marina TaxID=2163011 RepID=UPI001D1310DD|nr:CopD family protein [Orrella marina]